MQGTNSVQLSYQFPLQELGQSWATPHTVGKLAAEYHDEHRESPLQSYKL